MSGGPKISVNTLSLAPAPLDEQIAAVARLGLSGISPEIGQVEAFGAAATSRSIRDAGLTIATVTHRAFGFATNAETEAARGRLLHSIAIATEIGAESVIMTTGGRGGLPWGEAAKRFAESVAPCAQAAQSAGLRLGIEPTSHLYTDVSIAHRLADTTRLAGMAGIQVMLDLFACWFDSDIEDAIAQASDVLALIQVSDYVHGDRGLPCRAVPGDGDMPLERLLSAIVGTGFTGWFDLEIIGPRLPAEGHEAGLRRAAEHIARIVGR